MSRAGEAVHTAVTASAVGIDRLVKSHIGRIVVADHAARGIGENRLIEVLDDLILVPTVMRLLARVGFEAHGGIGDRTSALEFLMTHEVSIHAQTLRAGRPTVNPVVARAQHCIGPARPALRASCRTCEDTRRTCGDSRMGGLPLPELPRRRREWQPR